MICSSKAFRFSFESVSNFVWPQQWLKVIYLVDASSSDPCERRSLGGLPLPMWMRRVGKNVRGMLDNLCVRNIVVTIREQVTNPCQKPMGCLISFVLLLCEISFGVWIPTHLDKLAFLR
jgi:hypothetical protein